MSKRLKLIREEIEYDVCETIIEESKDSGSKIFKIRGPFLQAEVKNKNGRRYKKDVLEREVTKFQEKINGKRAYGELDHPPTPVVLGKNISHLITDLYMEGNTGYGTAQVMPTNMGRIVEGILSVGGSLGMSTRGVGTMSGEWVNEDYRLITADVVVDPSAPDCYVEGILENKEYIISGSQIVEAAIESFESDLAIKGTRDIEAILRSFIQDVIKNS